MKTFEVGEAVAVSRLGLGRIIEIQEAPTRYIVETEEGNVTVDGSRASESMRTLLSLDEARALRGTLLLRPKSRSVAPMRSMRQFSKLGLETQAAYLSELRALPKTFESPERDIIRQEGGFLVSELSMVLAISERDLYKAKVSDARNDSTANETVTPETSKSTDETLEQFRTPVPDLLFFGSFRVTSKIGVGEYADAFTDRAVPGKWHAYALQEADPPGLDDDAIPPDVLMCVAEEFHAHMAALFFAAEPIAEFSIHAARFVLGDDALRAKLVDDYTQHFGEQLDGVHGSTPDGTGIAMCLDGDGSGQVSITRLDGRVALVLVHCL